jgi:hypothetical protein
MGADHEGLAEVWRQAAGGLRQGRADGLAPFRLSAPALLPPASWAARRRAPLSQYAPANAAPSPCPGRRSGG